MILHLDNGRKKFARVSGPMPCVRAVAITFTAVDIAEMLEMGRHKPEWLVDWLATGPACRFGPYTTAEDLDDQLRAVEDHNRRLKGSEAIDDFHLAQFSAPPEQLG